MSSGGAGDRTTNLLTGRKLALATELQPTHYKACDTYFLFPGGAKPMGCSNKQQMNTKNDSDTCWLGRAFPG